jgi:hypothetical protein
MDVENTYNLDMVIVLGTLVGSEVVGESCSILADFRALSRVEVVDHAVVEGEHRRRRADFGAHVTDSSHTRAGERFDAGTFVFNDGTCTALDREDTRDLQDNVWELFIDK